MVDPGEWEYYSVRMTPPLGIGIDSKRNVVFDVTARAAKSTCTPLASGESHVGVDDELMEIDGVDVFRGKASAIKVIREHSAQKEKVLAEGEQLGLMIKFRRRKKDQHHDAEDIHGTTAAAKAVAEAERLERQKAERAAAKEAARKKALEEWLRKDEERRKEGIVG